MKKKKKKEKQLAGQGQAEQARQATRKMIAVPKGVKPVNSKQVNKRILKQVQGTEKEASQKAVLQNEENKVAWRGSAAQTWQHTPAREQFSQSAYRVVPSDNFQLSGFSHCSRVDNDKMDISFKRFQNTQGFARTLPEKISWSAISKHRHNYHNHHNHNSQYNSAADFTSDQLPPHGSIIFDYSQNQNTGSYHPRCESLAQPALASKPADTAPIRDVDVGSMLWQIRRALGVREPCRAEREARRQSGGAGAGAQSEQSTGGYAKEAAPGISSAATTPAQSSTSRSLVSVSNSGVHPFVAKPKVTSVDKPSQPCDKSLVAASNTDQALDSNNLVGQSSTPTTFPESNPNISHKVRIAHQPNKYQKGKHEMSLGSSAEARENLSWSRKKELEKGFNRYASSLIQYPFHFVYQTKSYMKFLFC